MAESPCCSPETITTLSVNWLRAVLTHAVVFDSLQPHGLLPTRLLCPWASPGKNTGVGCHALLQRIFPTQGLNPGLPHCRRILYQVSHQGSHQPWERAGIAGCGGPGRGQWGTESQPSREAHAFIFRAVVPVLRPG